MAYKTNFEPHVRSRWRLAYTYFTFSNFKHRLSLRSAKTDPDFPYLKIFKLSHCHRLYWFGSKVHKHSAMRFFVIFLFLSMAVLATGKSKDIPKYAKLQAVRHSITMS